MNLEEFKKKIDSMPWWETAYYSIRRFVLAPLDWPREIKYFIQRGRRGYADCDIWSIDGYLQSWLPQALRQLAKTTHACPPELWDDDAPEGEDMKRWIEVLNDMANKLEASYKWENSDHQDFIDGKQDWKEYQRLGEVAEKQTQEGLELLKKWFSYLWD